MRYLFLYLFVFVLTVPVHSQKIYKLQRKYQNANLNYRAFNQTFDGFSSPEIKEAFTPLKGGSDIYFFIAEYTGKSFTGETKPFHDYLILKTDPKTNRITDGFQYTLEWAEPPASIDLYRVSAKDKKIGNGLKVTELKMKCVDKQSSADRRLLMDEGVMNL